MGKTLTTIPDDQQYLYYAICELVSIPTANDLLDSGELAKYLARESSPPNPAQYKLNGDK